MSKLSRLPRPEQPQTRHLVAVAFLDVVGFSRHMAADEAGTHEAWSALQALVIEPRTETWGGRIVNKAGDGILAVFRSALAALEWALDVQAAVGRHPRLGDPLQLRIGLHLADIIDGPHGDAHGDGVNIAARLQNYADVAGIVVSRAVADEVRGKTDVVFTKLRRRRFKNIPRPIEAFRVSAGPRPKRSAWRRALPAGLCLGGIVAALALVIWLSPDLLRRATPRERAVQLTEQGEAIACPEYPCPREWLAQRTLFEQAIAADPSYAMPYAMAALTYTRFISSGLSVAEKDDLREAAQLTTRAIVLAPDQAFAYMARGAVLGQDPEKLDDALSAYLRAFAIDPHLPLAVSNAGWTLILLGRPAEAEQYLGRALALAPQHFAVPAWLNEMGLAELFLDRYQNAADFFRQAIETEPQSAAGADRKIKHKLNLAAALALGGDLDSAHKVIGELRLQHPALSSRNIQNGDCYCSSASGWLNGMAKLKQGVTLAGVASAG